MYRLVFFFLLFCFLSCSQQNPEKDGVKATSEKELRVWHQTDTIYNSVKWASDSLRQIKLKVGYSHELRLEAKSDAPVYLFQENSLLAKSSDGLLKYSFKTGVNNEDIFLTLDRSLRKLSYGLYSIKYENKSTAYSSLQIEGREKQWISNNILMILLIGASIFLVVIKFNYAKRTGDIFSFNKIFTTRLNEGEQSRVRIMDQDNIVFAGFYTFLTAGLIYFLSLGKNVGFLGIEANGIMEYLKILAIVAVGLAAKVILIAIASNLFGNSKIPAFYVKEMLNINLFLSQYYFLVQFLYIYLWVKFLPLG